MADNKNDKSAPYQPNADFEGDYYPHFGGFIGFNSDYDGIDNISSKPTTMQYVVFEGPDGSGKTTTIQAVRDALTELGLNVIVLREPGGTPTGELLRDVVFDIDFTKSMNHCLAVLGIMSASRYLLMSMLEDLEKTNEYDFVLVDRSVVTSWAHQYKAMSLLLTPDDQLKLRNAFYGMSVHVKSPDRLVLLDPVISIEESQKRKGGNKYDCIEPETIRGAYRELMGEDGDEHIKSIYPNGQPKVIRIGSIPVEMRVSSIVDELT